MGDPYHSVYGSLHVLLMKVCACSTRSGLHCAKGAQLEPQISINGALVVRIQPPQLPQGHASWSQGARSTAKNLKKLKMVTGEGRARLQKTPPKTVTYRDRWKQTSRVRNRPLFW